jgi:hypothetical protein
MSERQEYLDICEKSLRKYIAMEYKTFNLDQTILMLECCIICKTNMVNEKFGDIICFMCASICLDCLDPTIAIGGEEISRKFEKIQHSIRTSYEATYGNEWSAS